MIISICGRANSGKDTCANYIINKYSFTKIAFADPLKRILKDVFEFSNNQLWGESNLRNVEDLRYLRNRDNKIVGLSPRECLQKVGTDLFRDELYSEVWTEYLFRKIDLIKANRNLEYDQINDIQFSKTKRSNSNFIISDLRFCNEADSIRRRGGYVIKIERNSVLSNVEFANHQSEKETDDIKYDYLINNIGTYEEFISKIDNLMLDIIDNEAITGFI
jgi:hypothetical protein